MTVATHVLAAQMPDLTAHMYWYLGRASGFAAYWLLFASVAMGLAVSSRVFDGMLARPWVFELHKFLSIFVLAVMLFHGLIMLPDPYARFTLGELLVPGQSHYRNVALAAGICTLYGSALISASFYVKGVVGQKGWRLIHYLTFALFVAAMLHGIFAGSDTKTEAAQISYLASGAGALFLTFFRILAARSAGKPRAARPALPVSTPSRKAAA